MTGIHGELKARRAQLDFGQSGCVAQGVGPSGWHDEATFRSVTSARRRNRSLFVPERAAHGRQGIHAGGARLGIPCCGRDLLPLARGQPSGEQGDDREQGEQAGCGAGDGLTSDAPARRGDVPPPAMACAGDPARGTRVRKGTSAVRKGNAQTRPTQGIGASSLRLIQRSPLAFTKWLSDDRTGSR